MVLNYFFYLEYILRKTKHFKSAIAVYKKRAAASRRKAMSGKKRKDDIQNPVLKGLVSFLSKRKRKSVKDPMRKPDSHPESGAAADDYDDDDDIPDDVQHAVALKDAKKELNVKEVAKLTCTLNSFIASNLRKKFKANPLEYHKYCAFTEIHTKEASIRYIKEKIKDVNGDALVERARSMVLKEVADRVMAAKEEAERKIADKEEAAREMAANEEADKKMAAKEKVTKKIATKTKTLPGKAKLPVKAPAKAVVSKEELRIKRMRVFNDLIAGEIRFKYRNDLHEYNKYRAFIAKQTTQASKRYIDKIEDRKGAGDAVVAKARNAMTKKADKKFIKEVLSDFENFGVKISKYITYKRNQHSIFKPWSDAKLPAAKPTAAKTTGAKPTAAKLVIVVDD